MQVQNNSSQSFGSIHINTSKMNRAQKALSQVVALGLDYSPEYQKAIKKGIDVYFLPGKAKGQVNVRYIDVNSDCYLREPSGLIVNTRLSESGSRFKFVDNIKKELRRLCDGKFKRPKFDADKIVKKRTDVAKLRPEAYADLFDDFDDILRKLLEPDVFNYMIAISHIRMNKINSVDSFF